MSQSTTSKPVSSPRKSLERQRAPDAIVNKPTKLISLAKLKNLMEKSESCDQLMQPLVLGGQQAGSHQTRLGQEHNVLNSSANDQYSLREGSSRQSRDNYIEGESGEKIDCERNNSGGHHQSAKKTVALNQFGIRVTQQESEQPQNRTAIARRYYANNVTQTNTGRDSTSGEVESGGAPDLSSSEQASPADRQEQLDQAIRLGRKRKRVCSSQQSGANDNDNNSNELHRGRETAEDDKGIGPYRIDTCGRNNMTPSSDAFCQSFGSLERRNNLHSQHSFSTCNNRSDLIRTNTCDPLQQSDKLRMEVDKLSISLTPSPKSHPMEALAVGHHGPDQMIPTGVDHSTQNAMTVPETHQNQTNQHYNITGMSAVVSSQQHHQINQQRYSQYSNQPPASSSLHHSHHIATGHEQSAYNHLQHQHQHQQQPQQQQQQQQLHHHQHHHQQQQHQQQEHQQQHQQQAQSISNQQFIYHQIASSAVNPNHGYANVANQTHYHNQLQSNCNQANNLMAEAHQNHLNTAAAAAHAAAAVVSQTLKTVAHQHNHHQHQHYNNTISNGFNASSAALMNMTAQHRTQFHHGVTGPAQHHSHHHLNHNHVVMSIQPSQQQQPHHTQQVTSLPAHQPNHSIVTRKYQCRMCPQVFISKAEMKYHNQNHLREAKPYKCLQCPKAFANSSYLSQHMRIHQGLKPYACDICSRKFTQLSHLQQHKRTHTGDKPYKCTYMNCTKQFSQLSNLQSHSRCHQLDKPYKCNSCYKCFHDEQSLLEHIPRHLESKHLKRNLCIFCGSSYQQERGLVKHFQQYHTDKTPTLVTAAIAAGTTGNTSLIASLVSSSQGKFVTPSSGSTTSSISSNSSCNGSAGAGGGGVTNHDQLGEQNGCLNNTNMAHTNSTGAYQVSAGFR